MLRLFEILFALRGAPKSATRVQQEPEWSREDQDEAEWLDGFLWDRESRWIERRR